MDFFIKNLIKKINIKYTKVVKSLKIKTFLKMINFVYKKWIYL